LVSNRRHDAGFTAPFGWQSDDAGTRQRRFGKLSRQKGLASIWSSRRW
jgi:hypothetical protein